VPDNQALHALPDMRKDSFMYFFPTGEPPVVPERILRPLMRDLLPPDLRRTGETEAPPRDWMAALLELKVRRGARFCCPVHACC
jgi:hypothetical protein